jgi:hypothetical protein
MAVGDPLYRPFKVTLEEQWTRRSKLAADRRAYVVLRRMRELERAGRSNDAIWAGLESQKSDFNLAVALALVDLQRAAGDTAGVRQTMEGVTGRRRFSAGEAPLAMLLADRLREAGDPKAAVGVCHAVLSDRDLPKETRMQWLKSALVSARAAKDERLAVRWDEELKALTPPPNAPAGEAKK